MPRLSERLARLEALAAVSTRVRESSMPRSPALWEQIQNGLLNLGFDRIEGESLSEWLARSCEMSMPDMKRQLAGDWRQDLRPRTIGYYISGLLVAAKEDCHVEIG